MEFYMNKYHFIFVIFLFIACDKKNNKTTVQPIPTVMTEQVSEEINGIFQAKLSPINNLYPKLNGSLTLLKEKGEFVIHVRLSEGPPSVLHVQNIHVGTRCPNLSDDLNKDGVIDAVEGANVYQEIIIPLDDDLNSQRMGGGIFPVSDEYGFYSYSRTAIWDKFYLDLQEEDINPTDELIKHKPSNHFSVTNKVIIIKGIPETVEIPESVAGFGRLNKYQSLPVACGQIIKLTHSPGTIDDDHTDIPVPPEGRLEGGNDIDDGADFSNRPASDGGNYGEDDDMKSFNKLI